MTIQEVHVQRVNIISTEPYSDYKDRRGDQSSGYGGISLEFFGAQNEAEMENVVSPVTSILMPMEVYP